MRDAGARGIFVPMNSRKLILPIKISQQAVRYSASRHNNPTIIIIIIIIIIALILPQHIGERKGSR